MIGLPNVAGFGQAGHDKSHVYFIKITHTFLMKLWGVFWFD